MKWSWMIHLVLGILLISCSLSGIDQGQLNHPAMRFENEATLSPASSLTRLDELEKSSGSGACTVCAK